MAHSRPESSHNVRYFLENLKKRSRFFGKNGQRRPNRINNSELRVGNHFAHPLYPHAGGGKNTRSAIDSAQGIDVGGHGGPDVQILPGVIDGADELAT